MVAIILFLLIAASLEYFVVLYARDLGAGGKSENLLQWKFRFPGTDRIMTITVSPLFHLVPIAVIITLVFSWSYLTKYIAVKPLKSLKGRARPVKRGKKRGLKEVSKLSARMRRSVKSYFGKIKSGLLKIKSVAYLWREIHFARATIKSALTVLLIFTAFILLVSLLAYPQLIYGIVSNAYQNNPSLLNFTKSTSDSIKGIVEALTPINWICSAINNGLRATAPGFRNLALTLGGLIKPLADLDNAGKYLAFQNTAAWISAFTALFYGEYRRSHLYKKGKRR